MATSLSLSSTLSFLLFLSSACLFPNLPYPSTESSTEDSTKDSTKCFTKGSTKGFTKSPTKGSTKGFTKGCTKGGSTVTTNHMTFFSATFR